MPRSVAEIPRQVLQVREQLCLNLRDLLFLDDIRSMPERDFEPRFLSRALTALAVRRVSGVSLDQAAQYVIDGIADQGLDAIAPLEDQKTVLLVQTKWSDRGNATFGVDAAKAMVDGLQRIDDELFDQFNQRAVELAEQAQSLMNQVGVRTVLVIALMGTQQPMPPAQEVLTNALNRFNQRGEIITQQVLLARDFHEQVHTDLRPEPVDLDVRLDQWYQFHGTPFAFQGTASAEDVADWYREHGTRLFDLNLREPLGLTATNAELGRTLGEDPTEFWHRNNGITMLCQRMRPEYGSKSAPQSKPVTLHASAVSIVNGAQTVRAIARAVEDSPESAGYAQVSVKVIETQGAQELADQIAQATNRQNVIEPRDQVTRDPVHDSIKANLRAELHKQYAIKRGEAIPAPDSGCSLDELALALACLHPNPELAARVASSTENLWDQGSRGCYPLIFGEEPVPLKVWRSILTLRQVRDEVHRQAERLAGRAASVAQHGAFLITHFAFQYLGQARIDEDDFDWDAEVLGGIQELVPDLLRRLVARIDADFGERSSIRAAFQSAEVCKQLVESLRADLAAGVSGPDLAPGYDKSATPRKPRRQNTVPLLVERRALRDGARLEYYGLVESERRAMEAWLAEDGQRAEATWVNDRVRPILWTYDGKQYAPSGLVTEMWRQAGWLDCPVSNQGTARWFPNGGDVSLWGLALQIHAQDEEESGDTGE